MFQFSVYCPIRVLIGWNPDEAQKYLDMTLKFRNDMRKQAEKIIRASHGDGFSGKF